MARLPVEITPSQAGSDMRLQFLLFRDEPPSTPTAEAAYPLLLLSLGTPVWAVRLGFGRDEMYWQRLVESLGRNSLVGTTVRDPDRLPEHLAADEHHVDRCGVARRAPWP